MGERFVDFYFMPCKTFWFTFFSLLLLFVVEGKERFTSNWTRRASLKVEVHAFAPHKTHNNDQKNEESREIYFDIKNM